MTNIEKVQQSNIGLVEAFEFLQRKAILFSESDLVPDAFKKKPANCFIALQIAENLQLNPMQVFQNIYIVHGRPAFSSQFAIALANTSGIFDGGILFKTEGVEDKMTVIAYATHAQTKQKVSASFSLEQAKKAGYYSDKKPLWASCPQQMLSYRAASFLIRLYCPEVILGFSTKEEVEDLNTTKITAENTEIKGTTEILDAIDNKINRRVLGSAKLAEEPKSSNSANITEIKPEEKIERVQKPTIEVQLPKTYPNNDEIIDF